MNHPDRPRCQTQFYASIREGQYDAWDSIVRKPLEGLVSADSVRTVIDLYCGNGVMTAAALSVFSECTVHAVDFYDGVLAPPLQKDPRVIFHQGLVADVLAAGAVPPSDLVIMGFAGRTHGMTEETILFLRAAVDGLLLTYGDNAFVEVRSYFLDHFSLLRHDYDHDPLAAVYVGR
ncbi:hypothetical protein M1555_02130 [Patescibacteria group bacterium]|nr:hypothetical protein [Patescibacteria group bacterium]